MSRNPHHAQGGMVLVASMMILIIITLLGLSAMRSAGLEERMSGNQYDQNYVFEAAEAALREAEIVAAAPLTFTNACTNGLCPTPVAGATDRWMDSSFTGWKSAANANAGIVTAQYILEDMGAQPVDGTCHLQVPVEPTCLIPMVRITARAVAANGRGTSVTLQSNLRQ
ncbi:PilX N-terminal domain-containing pilus assembly protein [uncultured Zoogloea sp.]|uniref:pilus assembly PilX family protein n=1 Tax=uncultured Zoogloea sp. TaxID=160237 RepID=UPI002634CD3C|nr:PilX N-terminal domain-containing pilus assembly protein [uncultured Zoogloea sp.]